MILHLKDFKTMPCTEWLPRIKEFADAKGYTDYFEMFRFDSQEQFNQFVNLLQQLVKD